MTVQMFLYGLSVFCALPFVVSTIALISIRVHSEKLEIDRKSWHYRLNCSMYKFMSCDGPKTLCGYFWRTVLSVLCFDIMAFFVSAFVIAFIMGFGALTIDAYQWHKGIHLTYAWWQIALASIPGMIVFGIFMGIAAFVADVLFEHYNNNRNKPKKKSMLRVYLSAKKQKICPMITYK